MPENLSEYTAYQIPAGGKLYISGVVKGILIPRDGDDELQITWSKHLTTWTDEKTVYYLNTFATTFGPNQQTGTLKWAASYSTASAGDWRVGATIVDSSRHAVGPTSSVFYHVYDQADYDALYNSLASISASSLSGISVQVTGVGTVLTLSGSGCPTDLGINAGATVTAGSLVGNGPIVLGNFDGGGSLIDC
jgi:hypothetical protein